MRNFVCYAGVAAILVVVGGCCGPFCSEAAPYPDRIEEEFVDSADGAAVLRELLAKGGNFVARFEYLPGPGSDAPVGAFLPYRSDNVGKQIWGKDANFAGNGSYVRKAGMWNFEEVRVIDRQLEVLLNGYYVVTAELPEDAGQRAGIRWIGFTLAEQYRNFRFRELPASAKPGPCPKMRMTCPKGFTPYFDGDAGDLATYWKGVTTDEHFDNPLVRQAATPEKRAEKQRLADKGRDEHWHVKDGCLYFDGFKGGYSLATREDYEDFELWADWRILSLTGDSGLYLRGAPQVQIWDAHNQWHIGSGGLYNNQKNPSKALKIADARVGDWNRFHVIMRGEKVTVWLNGELVVDNVTLENYWNRRRPIFFKEQIELQCHGDPTQWRNIFIRHLPPAAPVDGKRIGACSWSFGRPLAEVAAEMDAMGVKGIHLALGPFLRPDGRHGEAESAETLEFVKERIASGKWKLMSTMIGTVGEDYSTLESIRRTGGIVPDSTWEENQRLVREGAKLTRELGAKYMTLHAGFLDESDGAAFAKYVERVGWMRDEAARHGVTILLESGQETADDLAKFLEKVPGVGINFDPANMILYGKGRPLEAVGKLAPWIRQVHVKDALPTEKPGTWGTEVPWGDGEVGAREFVAKLTELGYKGNFVIEREGGNSRVDDIRLAAERLR